MSARTVLAKSRRLASGAYRRTAGELVQRRRSKAYVAREQAEGRTVRPLLVCGPPVPARTAPSPAEHDRTTRLIQERQARLRGRSTR